MSSSVDVHDLAGAAAAAMPTDVPPRDPAAFPERLARLRERMTEEDLTHVVVYADREHAASLQYLTDFDPRFEEAVAVVARSGPPALLVGNEGVAFAQASPTEPVVVNVREFSLPNQPWHDAVRVDDALGGLGLRGARAGLVGWKPFDAGEARDRFDVPSYLVEALREAVGPEGTLRNATALLTAAPGGLRTRCSALEIAEFELSARLSADAVRRGLEAVGPGCRELDVAAALALPGLPLSMHPIVAGGDRAALGIVSASDRRLAAGDPLTIAVGFRGGLTARAGLVLRAEDADSPLGRRFLERLVTPYLDAIAAWHAGLTLGVTGGALHDAVLDAIGGRFELALNPGHLIHLEEWLDAPIRRGSLAPLESGMVLQCDMIPVPPEPGLVLNAEDTVALADEGLRAELEQEHPALWARAQRRRAALEWMLDTPLPPEVVPLSGLAGHVAPLLCSPDATVARRGGSAELVAAP